MKHLLAYLIDNLTLFGEISKSDVKLGGEDCYNLCLGSATFIFTRSDLLLLNELFLERMPYMTEFQISDWNRLLSYL